MFIVLDASDNLSLIENGNAFVAAITRSFRGAALNLNHNAGNPDHVNSTLLLVRNIAETNGYANPALTPEDEVNLAVTEKRLSAGDGPPAKLHLSVKERNALQCYELLSPDQRLAEAHNTLGGRLHKIVLRYLLPGNEMSQDDDERAQVPSAPASSSLNGWGTNSSDSPPSETRPSSPAADDSHRGPPPALRRGALPVTTANTEGLNGDMWPALQCAWSGKEMGGAKAWELARHALHGRLALETSPPLGPGAAELYLLRPSVFQSSSGPHVEDGVSWGPDEVRHVSVAAEGVERIKCIFNTERKRRATGNGGGYEALRRALYLKESNPEIIIAQYMRIVS